jgi:hypothetical protein
MKNNMSIKNFYVSLKLLFSEYGKKIVLFYIVSSLLYFIIGINNIITYINYSNSQIDTKIKMFKKLSHNSVDFNSELNHLCLITKCKDILVSKNDKGIQNLYEKFQHIPHPPKEMKKHRIVSKGVIVLSFIEINGLKIDNNLNFYIKSGDKLINTNVDNMIDDLFKYYFIIILFLMVFFTSILYASLKQV